MSDHIHRAGPLKQTNKLHKTGRHRSKGAIATKGKVDLKTISHKHKQIQRKEQRRNQINQIRKNKRDEAINLKRQLGTQRSAPFLVCILPMHLEIDPNSALAIFENCDTDAVVNHSVNGVTYINQPRSKQRFAFIIPPIGKGYEMTVLDYLKVCDTTLLLTSAALEQGEIFDMWGQRIFNMISAQGLPTPIVSLMDLESINPKNRNATKLAAQEYISKLLPGEKLMSLCRNDEGLNVLRRIGGQKKNVLPNKANRPHMFADKVEFVSNADSSNDLGTLKVTGFLRGIPLDVNELVHVPGLGDYQMSQINMAPDVYKLENRDTADIDEFALLAKSSPSLQTSLQSMCVPDAMDAEQTWPTEEEIQMAQTETKKMKLIKRIPKGYSDYQAAWIPDIETVEEEDNSESDDDDDDDDDAMDAEDEFISCNESMKDDDECDKEEEETAEDTSVSEAELNEEKYDLQMDFHEERETLKKIKEARADEMWPDEIDTPLDVAARDRFRKFRGLESFRTSPWDPKENLPTNYARIFQFQNFDRTKRRIIAESKEKDGVPVGMYMTIHIANVSAANWSYYQNTHQTKSVIVYGLLPYEHQMSVVNVVLKRTPNFEIPIKSKERLIIQCGYRRFAVRPIFSQHTNGDKYKFERYFRPHTVVCATFFAPIQFPPAPVLAFKENPNKSLALVAHGSVLSCNPDRIVLKRIVLSGHPMRINRKSATIRYMFFNKEDVNFFKPVKLRTKCGRLGHIKESLGTHGHMKCYFDGQLRSYDTAFMYLYKRVYPKWTYEEYGLKPVNVVEKQEEVAME